MIRFNSLGVVLARTNFGEADRIVTFITADHGKIKVIAKGVRKSKSKLAGGIELLSLIQFTVLKGRGEINTLMSARSKKFYGQIIKSLDATETAYYFIKLIDKNTEDSVEPAFFELLVSGLDGLDSNSVEPTLIRLWFEMQLLKLTGHAPNLTSDVSGVKLSESASYDFTHEGMHFVPKLDKKGAYNASQIKFLRVGFESADPNRLARVQGAHEYAQIAQPLVHLMLRNYLNS